MSVLDRLRDRRDGYDEYDEDDGERRRWLIPTGLLLVVIAAAVTVGPRIVSAISSRLHDDERSATTEPTTSTADGPGVTTSSVPLVASEPPVPPASSSSSAATIVASTTTSTRPVTVVALQTVPPIRDMIIRVGGVAMATDGLGQLAVGGLDAATTIEVVGRDAVPALQQVEFTGWGDGSTAAARTVGDLHGPVVQIGVAVSSRVVAEIKTPDGALLDRARIDVRSDVGSVTLVAGMPTWVVASRAVAAAGGLAVQQVVYVPTTVTMSDGVSRPAVEQALTPTPEALWTITVESSGTAPG